VGRYYLSLYLCESSFCAIVSVLSLWLAECHGTDRACCLTWCPGTSCCLWGDCSSATGAERFSLLYRRMENSFRTWLLTTYFCTRNALNRRAEVQKSTYKICAPVCGFEVCLFILNVFKFHFLLGNSSAVPWRFAVVS